MGLHRAPLPLDVAPAVEDEHGEAVVVGHRFDAEEDFGEEGVVDVVDDDAERLAALLSEVAGVEVRPVAEVVGGAEDGPPSALGDFRRVVHHQADEGAGHAGTAGDVVHRGPAHVLLAEVMGFPRHSVRRANVADGWRRSTPRLDNVRSDSKC